MEDTKAALPDEESARGRFVIRLTIPGANRNRLSKARPAAQQILSLQRLIPPGRSAFAFAASELASAS